MRGTTRSGGPRKALAKADGLLDEAAGRRRDAELHEARKAYKQARYAVEVFASAAGKPAKQLVNALTDLQDVLGAHQDSVVARELLHELAGAQDSFRFGVLWARQEQVGRDTYARSAGGGRGVAQGGSSGSGSADCSPAGR